MWEVAPTRAVAVTFTKFLLEPLEHIGRALSRFMRAPLEELPVQMWPIALAFMFLVVILVLVMAFGYNIRLPLWFGLEQSDRKHIESVANMNKQIQKRLKKYVLHTLRQLKNETVYSLVYTNSRQPSKTSNMCGLCNNIKSLVIKMMNVFQT
jgi:Tfp pilus assembly protein PilO